MFGLHNLPSLFEKRRKKQNIFNTNKTASTKIWAHRGASAYSPENTMAAFKLAEGMGADGIEIDVQLSRDGKIVVAHDETIDRVSSGTGYIKDYDLQELRSFRFNKVKPESEDDSIPTLEEVYAWAKDTNLEINVELKTNVIPYEGIEDKVMELTKKYDMSDRVIYSCFNIDTLDKIKKKDSNARVGLLYSRKTAFDGIVDYAVEHQFEALHPSFANLKQKGFVEECNRKGIKLNVWNVVNEKQMQECFKLSVNAVITDFPDVCYDTRGK